MEVSGQIHASAVVPPAPSIHWLGDWVGSRVGLVTVAKRKNPFITPAGNLTSVHVAIVCISVNTEVTNVRNFAMISDKFNVLGDISADIMSRNGSLNSLIAASLTSETSAQKRTSC
jgi:hypothetical protein